MRSGWPKSSGELDIKAPRCYEFSNSYFNSRAKRTEHLISKSESIVYEFVLFQKREMEVTTRAAVKRQRIRHCETVPRRKRRAFDLIMSKDAILYFQEVLPTEVLVHMFSYLRERDLCAVAQVCRRFKEVAGLESLWKTLFQRVFEMEAAYVPPTPATPTSHSTAVHRPAQQQATGLLKQLSWKEQFAVMYGCAHVCPRIASLPPSDPLRKEAPMVKYYSTISEAITNSSDGTRILVHPGVYTGSVTLDKPIVLIGAGVDKVTLVSSALTVVEVTPSAKEAVLANMTIKFEAPEDSPNIRQYCIHIPEDCCPSIHNCHFTNTSFCGSCIYIHGTGSRPYFSHCTVANANNVGIFVDDHAQGRFEQNNIHSNKLAGIWIKNFASPVFKKNEVHHGKDVGFFVFQDGQGVLEENDIHSNRIAGIEIKNDANPIIYRCSIHHGSTGGVYIHDKGRGQFIENKIFANTYAGVWITSESSPTLRDNEIHSGLQGGVYFFGGGRGVLEHNNIHSNTLAGVQIRTMSNPIIRNNEIHHGLHGGIYVHDNGLGLIEDNEIHSNALAGVWITTGSQPVLRHNRIHSGKQVGIYFYDNGGGVLEENDIYNHCFSGIQIRTGSHPTIRRNKIFGGKNGGILIYNSGEGLLEENDIYSNALAGVWIKTNSNPILRRNKIYNGKEGGVCIFNGGRGILEENDIFNNALTGILISSSSQPILRKNRVFGGKAAGIEVTNNGGGTIEDNEVFDNHFDGICLATGVNPQLSGNRDYGNRRTLEDAIQLGKCLYSISGDNSYPMHNFYRCLTCGSSENDAICVNCIKTCHKNHQIQFIRHDRFFCDCGAGALGCDCLLTGYKAYSSPKVNKLQQSSHLQPSIAVHQNTATS